MEENFFFFLTFVTFFGKKRPKPKCNEGNMSDVILGSTLIISLKSSIDNHHQSWRKIPFKMNLKFKKYEICI